MYIFVVYRDWTRLNQSGESVDVVLQCPADPNYSVQVNQVIPHTWFTYLMRLEAPHHTDWPANGKTR